MAICACGPILRFRDETSPIVCYSWAVFRTALATFLLISPLATAVPLCPEGEQSLVSEDAAGPDAADLTAPLDLDAASLGELEIVPCALMDSGTFGPVCVDAVGYLVTDGGAVLCQFSSNDMTIFDDMRAVAPVGHTALIQIDFWEVAALDTQRDDAGRVVSRLMRAVHPAPGRSDTQTVLSVWVPPA